MINLSSWFNANKITLFQKLNSSNSNPSVKNWILNLNGKKLFQTNSVKYLGIKIDKQLSCRKHISEVAIKLNRANAMLSEVREYVSTDTVKSIYYAIFDSHLNYVNVVWC